MTISSSVLDKICDNVWDNDELQCLREAMNDHHVQVGANKKTAWFFVDSWKHVFAKVKRKGHGDYRLKIVDKKKIQQACRHYTDEMLELGELLIKHVRKHAQK